MKHISLFTRSKFFISYLLIFFIVLITFFHSISKNMNILRLNLYKMNNASLEQSSSLIIGRFTEVLNLMNMIINNNDIQVAMQCENPVQRKYINNALDLVKLRNTLSDYMAANDFIDQILLYNCIQNYLITSQSIYLRIDYILFNDFLYGTDVFAETILNLPNFPAKTNEFISITHKKFGKGENYLMITRDFPPGVQDSCVVIFIDADKLKQYFSSDTGSGNYYILDESNKLLFLSESLFQADEYILELLHESSGYDFLGDEYIVSKIESAFKDLTFVSIIPSKKVLNDIYVVERTFIITLLLSVCICLIMSILLTRFNYKPIKNLITSLAETTGITPTPSTDEFTMIKEQFNSLVEYNMQGRGITSDYARKSFFSELLNGNFHHEQQIDSFMGALHIKIPNGLFYAVLLCRFNFMYSKDINSNIESLSTLKTVVTSKVEACMPGLVAVIDSNYNNLSIIINMKEQDEKAISNAALLISKELFNSHSIKLSFALSNWVRNLSELSNAYSNAISAIDHAAVFDNQYFVTYSESEDYTNNIYFPNSIQLKLSNAVLSTQPDEIEKILNDLFNKNIHELKISISSSRLLYYSLCTCLVDLSNRLNDIPPELAILINTCLNYSDRFNQDFKLLVRCFNEISQRFLLQKNDLQESIKQSLLDYIDENLCNNDLCLTMVAEKFRLSEPYISALIKEATGSSFIIYITNKRVEYAMKLLRETDYTIEQIAEKTGYNSPNSFRKAFKRITGQSPSFYKKGYYKQL